MAERFGDRDSLRFRAGSRISRPDAGRWDEASRGRVFIAECETSPHYRGLVREPGPIRLARGDVAGALEDRACELEQAREIKDPQRLLPALAASAARQPARRRGRGARLADEALELARDTSTWRRGEHLGVVAGRSGLRASRECGAGTRRPVEGRALAAARAICAGRRSVRRLRRADVRGARAARGGEELIEAGRRAEGEAELEKALSSIAPWTRRSSSSAARRCSPRLRALQRSRARSGPSCRRGSRPPRRRGRRARRGGRRSAARRRGHAVLALHLRPEVDALEHERPQREHRLPYVGLWTMSPASEDVSTRSRTSRSMRLAPVGPSSSISGAGGRVR